MTEGSDSKRRLIMMLTIILAGTAVTFIDLSPLAVIFIALGIGLVMLFALKMITIEELKEILSSLKDKLNQPVSLKKDKTQKDNDKTAGKKPGETEIKKGDTKKELPFASLFRKLPFISKSSKKENIKNKETVKSPKDSFFSGIFGLLSKKKETETKTKQIDELLDKTLNEKSPLTTETSVSDEGNEFSDFDNFDLGLEDDTSEIPEDINSKGFEDEISDSTIADILAKEGIELELDDEEFPKTSSDNEEKEEQNLSDKGLGDMDELDNDVSGLDLDDNEFGEFEDIDLDELEPEDEIDLGEEDTIENIEIGDSKESVELTPVEDENILSAPPKEWTQTKSNVMAESEDNMFENPISMSFSGNTSDDDLFDMLKSDTKKAVTVQESSLVRDLIDAKINSEELVEGLEDVLEQFGVKKEQIKEKEIITDEEI